MKLHPFKTVDKLYELLNDRKSKSYSQTDSYERKLHAYFTSAESTEKWSAALMQKYGDTALHLMVMNNYAYSAIKLAVKFGADPDAKNKHGRTPLDLAIDDRRVRATHFILEAGADIDPSSASWHKTIHFMLSSGDTDIVDAMYKRGVDFDHPFIWECVAKNTSYMTCARKLLSYGAKPQKIVVKDESIYRLALEKGNAELAQCIIEHGIGLHNPEEWRIIAQTPVLSGCARTLMEAGAKLENIVYDNGDTPLHIAVRADNEAFADYLSRKTGGTAAYNAAKETPLHLAIQTGNVDLVKALATQPQDLDVVNGDGLTPAALAKSVFTKGNELDQVITHLERDIPKKEPEQNPWLMLDKAQVAHVQEHEKLGKKFTHIFNFATHERMTVVDDLAVKTSTCVITRFGDIDPTTLSEAFNAYQAGEGAIPREAALAGISELPGSFARKDFGIGEKP